MKNTTARKAHTSYTALTMNGYRYYVVSSDGTVRGCYDKLDAKGTEYKFGGEILTTKQAQKRGLVS